MLHWRSLPLLHFQRVNVLLLMLSSNSRWLLQKLLCLATAVLATGWWPGKFVIFCERSEHSPEASPEVSLAFSFFSLFASLESSFFSLFASEANIRRRPRIHRRPHIRRRPRICRRPRILVFFSLRSHSRFFRFAQNLEISKHDKKI